MEQKQKTYFNWSSGKDAAFALYLLKKDKTLNIDKLLTSINTDHNKVSMHGVRRGLLEKQAESIGLSLDTIELSEELSMEEYNLEMQKAVSKLKSEGYTSSGFGDIFLEDLRMYREEQLKTLNISCLFPLWKKDTKELIHEFLALGFKAIVICIKSDLLDTSFLGRVIDERFISDLPSNVDPCGENGEFHTFCFDGPIFTKPIPFLVGDKIFRSYKNPNQDDDLENDIGFWYCDLLPC